MSRATTPGQYYYPEHREANIRKAIERSRQRNLVAKDAEVPARGRAKADRINLGLHLLCRRSKPGVPNSVEDIAIWCGCTHQQVTLMYASAMRKVRAYLHDHPELAEEFRVLLTDR